MKRKLMGAAIALAAFAVTDLTTYHLYYKKKMQQTRDKYLDKNIESHMDGWRKGYDDARFEYNRHPHLNCKTCYPPTQ